MAFDRPRRSCAHAQGHANVIARARYEVAGRGTLLVYTGEGAEEEAEGGGCTEVHKGEEEEENSSSRGIRTRLEQAITTRRTTHAQLGCILHQTGTCTSIAGAAKSLSPVHEGPTTPRAPRRVRPRSLGEQYANRHAQARRAHPRAKALTCPPSAIGTRMAAMRKPPKSQRDTMPRDTGARQRTSKPDNNRAPVRQRVYNKCTGGGRTRRDRHIGTLPAAITNDTCSPATPPPLKGASRVIHVPIRAAFQNTPRNLCHRDRHERGVKQRTSMHMQA